MSRSHTISIGRSVCSMSDVCNGAGIGVTRQGPGLRLTDGR
ncbi:protein of unknown function [Azospirillum lipoferum 4B]|uniref:Uncharacterized protein n=1 Tax=Azospirillum lipoferum (strain 4B) TaxID=862719 RepID=G7Z949_AZOL4|nr:protein of unknown function [Azospirillum lipoferum 4B]